MEETHIKFMREAIAESRQSLQQGCGPTGCVIVKDGSILARGHNQEHTSHDPTAHAEIVVIRQLCQDIQSKDLSGCTLYSTLQPCGMCSVACLWANISTIVYGASRADVSKDLFAEVNLNISDFIADAKHANIEVISGILADECAALYSK